MAWRQGALGPRSGGIHDVAEIRQAARMYVWILLRIFVRIRMLDHPAGRLRFLHDPRSVAFLQIVGDLHARSRRTAGLWPELNFGVRLIAVDGNAADVHLHGAYIESAHAVKVQHDACANGVVVALLLLASGAKQLRGGERQGQGDAVHARVFSSSRRRFIL